MTAFQLFLCVVFGSLIYWMWTRRKFYALAFKIPGPLGFPILGIAPYFMCREDILQTLDKYCEQYGTLFFSWLGPYPFLGISDPDIAQNIFTSQNCINKSISYKAVDKTTGNGLFSLRDPDWSVHRKHLNPAFKNKVLLCFIPIFNEEVNHLIKALEILIENNKSADLRSTIHNFALRMVTRTTMGKDATEDDSESKEKLLNSYKYVLEKITEMVFAPWLCIDIFRKVLGIYDTFEEANTEIRSYMRKLIEQTSSSYSLGLQSADHKQIFIEVAIDLMRNGVFSLKDVEDESYVMVIGAFETTSTTILHALILLAMFPQYQQKAFEELLTIFPEDGDFNVSYSNIQDMVYMDMVINESMRVLTPVPIVARETSNEVKLSNGVIIPKGIQVAIYIHRIHRRVDIWGPDAHLFNPDNFLPSNIEGKHPYAFIPFSKGIRNCIGWRYGLISVKIALAKLLRNFKFSTDFQYKDLVLVEDIVLKLKHVPQLGMQKRNT